MIVPADVGRVPRERPLRRGDPGRRRRTPRREAGEIARRRRRAPIGRFAFRHGTSAWNPVADDARFPVRRERRGAGRRPWPGSARAANRLPGRAGESRSRHGRDRIAAGRPRSPFSGAFPRRIAGKEAAGVPRSRKKADAGRTGAGAVASRPRGPGFGRCAFATGKAGFRRSREGRLPPPIPGPTRMRAPRPGSGGTRKRTGEQSMKKILALSRFWCDSE